MRHREPRSEEHYRGRENLGRNLSDIGVWYSSSVPDTGLSDILLDQNPWWTEPAARRTPRDCVARRDIQRDLLRRLKREARRACLVLGPRQVGKTIALLQLADDLLDEGLPPANLTYFDFSDDRLTAPVAAREVEEIRAVGFQADRPRVLLLDEIRLAPSWDRWLKQAVDEGAGRVVATDSAASLLRGGSRESGQGRWDELIIEGLNYAEFIRFHQFEGEDDEAVLLRRPTLHEQYTSVGGFPEHFRAEDFAEVRRRLRADIAERAILRDLLASGVEVQRVKDLFVYLVQDSGSVFKAEKRARDLDPRADPRSVRAWLDLLEATLLVVPLERFARSASARLRSAPRIYAADHGLVNAFAVAPVREEQVRAKALEAMVFRHLRELSRRQGHEVFYFREGDDLEIDFVVSTSAGLFAVEVTANREVRPDKLAALRRGRARLKPTRTSLIHRGVTTHSAEGIEIVPLASFLRDPGAAVGGGG